MLSRLIVAGAAVITAYALVHRRRARKGLCTERFKRITDFVQREVVEGRAPFLQAIVVRDGAVVHVSHPARIRPSWQCLQPAPRVRSAFLAVFVTGSTCTQRASAGFADLERQTPLSEDTLIRIYSMTKAIASAGAMILVERAQLYLDRPVEQYLPCFKGVRVFSRIVPAKGTWELVADEEVCTKWSFTDEHGVEQLVLTRAPSRLMTVQHLLTHTSGITYDFMKTVVSGLYVSRCLTRSRVASTVASTIARRCRAEPQD